jgi:tRNA dimethylallyltransferase
LQGQFDEGQPASAVKVFVLSWPREELHRRIDARVEQMFAAGLVEEVQGLLAKYGGLSRTAMQAVGYREVVEWLGVQGEGNRGQETGDRSPESLAECIERVKARTRQFARRQETWFRALSESTFVPMQADLDSAQIATHIFNVAASRHQSQKCGAFDAVDDQV